MEELDLTYTHRPQKYPPLHMIRAILYTLIPQSKMSIWRALSLPYLLTTRTTCLYNTQRGEIYTAPQSRITDLNPTSIADITHKEVQHQHIPFHD
eukprot:8593231-Ditylum_brightwellii.AAC.1